jgi:Ca2+:H+ antiporter
MRMLLSDLRSHPLYWLLIFVPIVLVAEQVTPERHTALFLLSVAAVVPLAGLLSRATESVAAKTGDLVGGLLNATLGNLTELVLTLAALREGMPELVKAALAGAIVTNTLFMLGGSFLLGGLRHRVQEFSPVNARVQTGMLLLATIALLIPSSLSRMSGDAVPGFLARLSVAVSVILLATYGLSLLFSLRTHRQFFVSAGGEYREEEEPWPLAIAIGALVAITILVALVVEIFVASVETAGHALGMTQAFVGFIVVSLVGGAAEMAAAFSAARKDRLDLSVGIAMGSSVQIALFVTPVLVFLSYAMAPSPLDLVFGGGAVLMVILSTITVSLVTNGGRAAWYSGVQLLAVYLIFAVTLYLLPQ